MRILLLTPDFPLWDGGVSAWAGKLAHWLPQLGHDLTVLTPRQLPGDTAHDASLPCTVLRTPNLKDRHAKYFFAHLRLALLRSQPPFDAILATTWHPYALPALRWLSRPATRTILMAHGNDFLENRWQRPYWRRRMLRAFRSAHGTIAVSHETERVLRETVPGLAGPGRLRVIFPAVDPADFTVTPFPPDPPILLSLGRVVERKGQDMVIRALPALLKSHPNLQYWIAGRGAFTPRLQALATSLGVADHVRFLGFIPDAERAALYQRCTVYLMPSRTIQKQGDFEGFGITYLEANASGRPVIGGRSGGVADAVEDGTSGFLVDPESPSDIATITSRLLSDRDLCRRIGLQGRARVEQAFTWAHATRAVADYLASS